MTGIQLIFLQGCPFSEKALEMLERRKVLFDLIEVTQSDKSEYIDHPIRTFPKLSFGNMMIGGNHELHEICNSLDSATASFINIHSMKSGNDHSDDSGGDKMIRRVVHNGKMLVGGYNPHLDNTSLERTIYRLYSILLSNH